MIQISLPYIYSLPTSLQSLRALTEGTPIKDSIYALYTAESALNGFLMQSVYSSSLRATKSPGMKLLAAIQALTQDGDLERTFTFYETYNISSLFSDFETILMAEMNVAHTYLVTKKRAFDTGTLIASAEEMLTTQFSALFPEAIGDIRHAGRCIAFEMGTAAGFHIMRAIELVLRRYWDAVTKGRPRPERFNIGDYLREMESLGVGEEKTRAVLRQIKDLHRNELMHPETTLDLDEAIGLFGISQSAIDSMMREIPGAQLELPETAG